MKWSKLPYKNKGGETKRLSRYYATFRDHRDITRRVCGFTDIQASEQFGRRVDELVGLRATHQMLDKDMVHWLEQLSDYHREKFTAWDMIDDRASSLSRPLDEHIEDYRQDMLTNDRSAGYVKLKCARVAKLICGAGFVRFRDIDTKVVKLWGKQQRDDGMSKRTWAHYVDAIRSFCTYMVESGRAAASPVQNLRAVEVDDEDVRGRAGLDTLCAHTYGTDTLYGLSGPERALLYWLAFESTQRKVTLGQITPRHLKITRDQGVVTGGSMRTIQRKGRTGKPRVHLVPLKAALAEALEAHATYKAPDVPLFKLQTRCAEMMRADLLAAGLPTVDEEGNAMDFHSLRHSGMTWWAESGADIQTLMQISGHKSVRMLDRYLNHRNADAAVRRLDEIDAPAPLQMTGTADEHDIYMKYDPHIGADRGTSVQQFERATDLTVLSGLDRCPSGRRDRFAKPA